MSRSTIAVLLVSASLAGCAGARLSARSPVLVGRPVDVAAPDMTGRLIDVGEARGRVRVVDFWATWCEPCVAALEGLDRLAAASRGDLAVYAVSLDEERAPLEAFLVAHRLGVTVLWDQNGRRHAEPLGIEQLPTTFLVDRAGAVRFVHRGWQRADDESIRQEVGRLLAEPAPVIAPP